MRAFPADQYFSRKFEFPGKNEIRLFVVGVVDLEAHGPPGLERHQIGGVLAIVSGRFHKKQGAPQAKDLGRREPGGEDATQETRLRLLHVCGAAMKLPGRLRENRPGARRHVVHDDRGELRGVHGVSPRERRDDSRLALQEPGAHRLKGRGARLRGVPRGAAQGLDRFDKFSAVEPGVRPALGDSEVPVCRTLSARVVDFDVLRSSQFVISSCWLVVFNYGEVCPSRHTMMI